MSADEIEHDPLELLPVRLAVGNGDPHVREDRFQVVVNDADIIDYVVDEEYLASPGKLIGHRLLDDGVVELHHLRLDREPVERRRIDDAQVLYARDGHMERPGNRGGAQGKNVDTLLEELESFLMFYPEPVLLVHDQQSEVLELDIFLKEPVGPHDEVCPALFQALDGPALFLACTESAQRFDRDRVIPKPFRKGLVVLLREDRVSARGERPVCCRSSP